MSIFRRDFNSTFDYHKTRDEVCGTCKHNRRDYDGSGIRQHGGFYCGCDTSDCCGCPTSYIDTCEEWEER